MRVGMVRKLMAAAELKLLNERKDIMGLKGLAEGIILQSIDDLWVRHHREDCSRRTIEKQL